MGESAISKVIQKKRRSFSTFLEVLTVNEREISKFRRLGLVGFYSIASGHHAVELLGSQKRSVIRICGPGDLVGFGNWLSPFSSERYQLRSLENGEIHFMPRQAFEQLSLEIPELNSTVINSLCKIIALKDERIAALETNSVKDRVKALLSSLSRKFGKDTTEGRLINVKIDRPTLAALAGTSLESFSRTITELEDENLVDRKRRKILIKGSLDI